MRGKIVRGLVLFLVLGVFAGCSGSRNIIGLKLVEPEPNMPGGFQDERIRIVFATSLGSAIRFQLHNRTDETMRLIWDEVVLVDFDGGASRVMHSGVKYIDRNESQPPSVIPPGSKITDLILPADLVYWGGNGSSQGWRQRNLVPEVYAITLSGHRFDVVLPVEVGDERTEYQFTFEVDVRVE